MTSSEENPDQGASSDRPTTGARIIQRLPWLALVAVMAFLVARHYQGQPSTVVVNYHLGAYRAGLSRMILSYRQGQQILRSMHYDFSTRPALATITHRVKLPDGDYRVTIELYFRQKMSLPRMRTTRLSDRAFRLVRSLPIRGSAEVRILIGDES